MERFEHIQIQLSDRCSHSEFWISVALSSIDGLNYFLFLSLEDPGKKEEKDSAPPLLRYGQQGPCLLCVLSEGITCACPGHYIGSVINLVTEVPVAS